MTDPLKYMKLSTLVFSKGIEEIKRKIFTDKCVNLALDRLQKTLPYQILFVENEEKKL